MSWFRNTPEQIEIGNWYVGWPSWKFEITYNGGARIDGIITDGDWVYLNHGIATFTGTSYWDSGMQGYLFVNADGSITLSYSTTYGAEDGSFEPILLKK